MANFYELRNKLVKLSNRPDLIAELEIAIDQAVTFYHHLDFFWRDLVEGMINVTSGRKAEYIVPLTTFPRLRAVKGVSPYNTQRDCCGAPLKLLKSFDECKCELNWYMQMGANLKFSTNSGATQFKLAFYQNPKLLPREEFSSWVVDLYESCVIDAALMFFFKAIRDFTASREYERVVGSRVPLTGYCREIVTDQLEQEIRSY